jgi:hypothetical protein
VLFSPGLPLKRLKTRYNPVMKRSLKKWVLLLVLPYASLIGVSFLQLVVRFSSSGSGAETGAVATVMNITSLLVGLAAVLLIIGTPLWVILLIRDHNFNRNLQQVASARPPEPPLPPPAF